MFIEKIDIFNRIFLYFRKYMAGTCAAIVGSGREENRNNTYPHAAGLAQPSGIAIVQECKVAFLADSESSAIRQLHLDSGQVSAVCGGDKNPAVCPTTNIFHLFFPFYVCVYE